MPSSSQINQQQPCLLQRGARFARNAHPGHQSQGKGTVDQDPLPLRLFGVAFVKMQRVGVVGKLGKQGVIGFRDRMSKPTPSFCSPS